MSRPVMLGASVGRSDCWIFWAALSWIRFSLSRSTACLCSVTSMCQPTMR